MVKDILLTVLSSIMLIAAFPPLDMGFLAWVGMVPLFFALSGKNTGVSGQGSGVRRNIKTPISKLMRRGFLLGFLWGIVFFLGTVYWVVNSMAHYGGIPIFTSILILLLLVVCLSLFTAVFGLTVSKVLASREPGLFLKILFVSSFWVSLEYIRANVILGGFPWVLLGYSQSSLLSLIQIADITGVYGISFLIVMVNMCIFLTIKSRGSPRLAGSKVNYQRLEMRGKYFSPFTFHPAPFFQQGAFVFLILIGVLVYGFLRMYQIERATAQWKTLKVALVQGNIDQSKKWDISFQKETVDIYRDLSLDVAKEKPSLIIWPETAVPFYLQSDKNLGPLILNVPKETDAYLLTGSPAYGLGFGDEINYYNSAFLISPEGEIMGRYDKIHLVPFGEYVPLKKYLPFIHKLVVGVGDFSSGTWFRPLEFNGNRFGVLICFESIFPELSRGFIKEGAGFLVNITNDAWFGRTSAPYQHFSQAVFRAVENKVFLVRAANTGISGVIEPVGRVSLKSGIFTKETMIEKIRLRDGNLFTFYSRYGDIFAVGCLIISSIGLGLWVVGLKKRDDS